MPKGKATPARITRTTPSHLAGPAHLPVRPARPPTLAPSQFYGLSEGAEVVPFGDQAAAKFGAFFVTGGKVVGAFLEGGSAEENAAIKRVAAAQPAAPADLGVQGLGFALAQA